MLKTDSLEDVSRALLTHCGGMPSVAIIEPGRLERYFFSTERCIYEPAAWGWALVRRHRTSTDPPSPEALDRLLSLWFEAEDHSLFSFAMEMAAGIPRKTWGPTLTDEQRERVKQAGDKAYESASACVIAFHSRTVWPDRELARRLFQVRRGPTRENEIDAMIAELEIDEDELQSLKAAARDRASTSSLRV